MRRSLVINLLDIRYVSENSFPVDTGRTLNVHKTFRRRPSIFGGHFSLTSSLNFVPSMTSNATSVQIVTWFKSNGHIINEEVE